MQTELLTVLEEAYISYHQSQGRSRFTWGRHHSTHKLFHRFLVDTGLPATSRSLTTEVFRQFSRWLQETPLERPYRGDSIRSPYGVRAALKDMRAFTYWLFEEGRLETLPKVPMPRMPETLFPILSDEEMESLWQSKYLTGRSPMAVRNRALIGLLLDTGIRRAEAAGIKLADVDLENSDLTVIGKGNKQRRVPYSTSVKVLLAEWIALRGQEDGELFWLKAAGIRQVFRVIKEDVGLAKFHPHMLRHQAATEMVRNNADVETVRRILGHTDIATTMRYLSMSDDDIKAKHAASSPFDSMVRKAASSPQPKRKRLSLKAS